jgi:hypothetical protein
MLGYAAGRTRIRPAARADSTAVDAAASSCTHVKERRAISAATSSRVSGGVGGWRPLSPPGMTLMWVGQAAGAACKEAGCVAVHVPSSTRFASRRDARSCTRATAGWNRTARTRAAAESAAGATRAVTQSCSDAHCPSVGVCRMKRCFSAASYAQERRVPRAGSLRELFAQSCTGRIDCRLSRRSFRS